MCRGRRRLPAAAHHRGAAALHAEVRQGHRSRRISNACAGSVHGARGRSRGGSGHAHTRRSPRAAARAARRAERLRRGHRQCRRHLPARSAARGADRGEEAALHARDRSGTMLERSRVTRSCDVPRPRTLKRAQDLLGRMHDLEMLIARTRAVQGPPQAPNLQLSADLDRLVRRLETECRRLHGRYMTRRALAGRDLRPCANKHAIGRMRHR